jgi:undecaprenyl-diphosphatase
MVPASDMKALPMTFINLFLLAVIQGITEFLPVSSSAHLILLPALTTFEDQGLVIDVAVHVGTLFAVIAYFWRDVALAARGVPDVLRWKIDNQGAWLALCLGVATVPVVIVGLILKVTGLIDMMRSVALIGWMMIIFGVILYIADHYGKSDKVTRNWGLRDAVILGLWQAVALIPGTSRSGACITGARALGYTRHDAAKISMLMSIPTIIASGALLGLDLVGTMDAQAARDGAIAAALAFLSALAALGVMMRLLQSVSFTPYVVYRLGLGVVLLWIAYT